MKRLGEIKVPPVVAGLVVGLLVIVIAIIYYTQLTKTMPRPGTPTPMTEALGPSSAGGSPEEQQARPKPPTPSQSSPVTSD